MLVLKRAVGDAGLVLYLRGETEPLGRIELVEQRGREIKLSITAGPDLVVWRGELTGRTGLTPCKAGVHGPKEG